MERFELKPGYSISRVIKGGWHLAGGHGNIDKREAISDMRSFVEAGITTFDCADIYTGVEELIGEFLKTHRHDFSSGNLPPVQIHTKYVPDHNALNSLKREDTTRIIDRSLKRLGVDRLDLVQFAWWDYSYPGYIDTALHLSDLQSEGKIRYIGITNFDAERLRELVDAGVNITANQLQYSILDRRPESDFGDLDQQYQVPFLCYGSVAGGFLSDRYLAVPETGEPLKNRSLVKYRLIIDEFGGYEEYQELLSLLKVIGNKHDMSIAEIACSYILQKPAVAGIIVGATNTNHLDSLSKLSSFELDMEDLAKIDSFLSTRPGPKGPVYELERDKTGRHGSIMRYNLNQQRTE